jgi:uncharacterized membrane protein YhhN
MSIKTVWLAQVALFVAGIVGPWRDAPETHTNGRVARPIRMALSVSLLVAAAVVYAGSSPRVVPYAGWVFLGMAASCLGDFIMARLIVLPNRLIGGMAAFGVAHLLYITAYIRTLQRAGAPFPNAGLWAGLVIYGAVSMIGWWMFIRTPEKPKALNVGALVYGSWIAVMAACALALAVGVGGGFWLTALGAVSFIASDFLIGATDIRGRRLANANDWIWLTYVAGQMGIIYAGRLQ